MLEQVARSIFAKHAAALGHYDPRRSGAEYWSLCIDADDDDVGLHWDKVHRPRATHALPTDGVWLHRDKDLALEALTLTLTLTLTLALTLTLGLRARG